MSSDRELTFFGLVPCRPLSITHPLPMMAFLPALPRSLPVSAKQLRLIGLVLATLVVLHVLHLLPGSSASASVAPPPKTAPAPRRQEPEHVQKYLGQVLEDARRKAVSHPAHQNRPAGQRLDRPKDAGGNARAHGSDGTQPDGNTLVLATHAQDAHFSILAVRHSILEDAHAFIPGINTGHVRTWLPGGPGSPNDAKATADIDTLVSWIDAIAQNLDTQKSQGKPSDERLADSHGSIGGVVLGSCEHE